MTEDQIECKVERITDRLDRLFMSGAMSESDYRKAMRDLEQWANRESDFAKRCELIRERH